MTEQEARALANQYVGISVEYRKRDWYFFARFHATLPGKEEQCKKVYAGKDFKRALLIRQQLKDKYAKNVNCCRQKCSVRKKENESSGVGVSGLYFTHGASVRCVGGERSA